MSAMMKSASTRSAVRSAMPSSGPIREARRSVAMKASWLPGQEIPAWLPADMAGNYGFDPLELAKEPEQLERYREVEVIHCRWAMLGVVGCLSVEALGFGNWYDAPLWAASDPPGKATWFGIELPFDASAPVLLAIEFAAFFFVEQRRTMNKDAETRIYPGGAFDPLGFSKDAATLATNKVKEIKNGRMAMVAMLALVAQHAATDKGPIAALTEHLANPFEKNFATNGVSIPGL